MESVDVMAGVDTAASGGPLIEVIDEGQVDLSSDGIESFVDSSSSSSLTLIFSNPPSDFLMLWMRATVPPRIHPLLLLFPSFWSSWVSL